MKRQNKDRISFALICGILVYKYRSKARALVPELIRLESTVN